MHRHVVVADPVPRPFVSSANCLPEAYDEYEQQGGWNLTTRERLLRNYHLCILAALLQSHLSLSCLYACLCAQSLHRASWSKAYTVKHARVNTARTVLVTNTLQCILTSGAVGFGVACQRHLGAYCTKHECSCQLAHCYLQ